MIIVTVLIMTVVMMFVIATATSIEILLHISDYRLIRRLVIQADYDIPCSDISSEASRAALSSTANYNYNQIMEKVCQEGELYESIFVALFVTIYHHHYTDHYLRLPCDSNLCVIMELFSSI